MSLPQKISSALARRDSLLNSTHTDTYRLIHRAADGFPDLTVDRYADVLIANLYSAGLKVTPPLDLLQEIAEKTHARSVYIKYRPTEASKLSKAQLDSLAPPTPIIGDPVDQVIVTENGIKFIIRPADGLSSGLFLDMREMRAWVRDNAKDKTVLNCFAYTCGFGVAALVGGATRAVNIDISKKYLEWGKENATLNGFTPDPKDFIRGDVFDWLKRFGKRDQKFDIVILDPPPYSTTKESRFSIQRDYADLVSLAAKVVAPNGYLIACANAAEVSEKQFMSQIKKVIGEQLSVKIADMKHEPEVDFPSEGEHYLKIVVIKFG
ncbi:MAG: class I SAM-dependent rRNA methyltransferase [Chloroflexota bacterium]